MDLLAENERTCWFQKDEASVHIAKTRDFLQGFFDDCIVGRGLWPPLSPGLKSPDLFPWGFLKESIYSK
jgi:hypothetical protein